MNKYQVRFQLLFLRIKTYILNAIFFPYIYFDYDSLIDKDKKKQDVTKRLPE
jgi:hypothetical protein